MRVIFLNRFYRPDEPATAQLLTDLATALAARGDDVTVITSQPAASGIPRTEVHDRVRILRVRGTRWGRHHLAGRAVDFATFLAGALWRLFRTARKGDIVVAMTDPPLLGLMVWPVARGRGVRCVQWVQDVFPEVAMALNPGHVNHALGRILGAAREVAWRRSDHCVAISHDMAAFIARAGVAAEKITTIPNWAPQGLLPPAPGAVNELRRAWGLAEKFIVAYSGNLGRVHDLEPVLDVAAALQGETRIAFVFIGDGAQRAALEEAARSRGLANVRFQPPQPRAGLAVTLGVGDVHLVTLRAGCEALVFPSKLYGIAAVGRPVIYIGPRGSEVARMVDGGGFGLAFTRDETAAIAAGLKGLAVDPARCALLADRALEFSRAEGEFNRALTAWSTVLSREAACRKPAESHAA